MRSMNVDDDDDDESGGDDDDDDASGHDVDVPLRLVVKMTISSLPIPHPDRSGG